MNALTREQRIYAAAGASILFVISLFFNWRGEGDFSASGTEVVPSFWILLIFSAVAAVVLIAEAVDYELPGLLRDSAPLAAYLTSVSFIVTLMIFIDDFEGIGRKFGIFLALLFSAAAFGLSVYHWRQEK